MTKFLADYLLSNEGKNLFPANELYKLKPSLGNRFSFQSFLKKKSTPIIIKDPYTEIVKQLKAEQKQIVERGVAEDMLQIDTDNFRTLFKKRSQKVSYKKFKKIFGIKKYNYKKFKISNKIENIFKFNLTILVKKNNIFCTFSNFDEKKTIKSCSSGKYRIKVSKKTLRYTYDLVLDKFYRDIRKHVYPKTKKKNISIGKRGLFVTLVCSKRLRKKVSQSIRRNFKKIPLLIKVLNKKVFNGCRPPKKVRKKRRRMRIYK